MKCDGSHPFILPNGNCRDCGVFVTSVPGLATGHTLVPRDKTLEQVIAAIPQQRQYAMIEKSTYENPHNFEQAKQWLAENPGQYDYEVVIGRHHGALMTRETWLESVAGASFIDYDGMGNEIAEDGTVLGEAEPIFEGNRILVQEGKHGWIKPSEAARILPETKYILWYNR